MRCDDCKHWIKDPGDSYRAVQGIGQCGKATQLWDATEWAKEDDSDDAYTDRIIKPEFVAQMSFVQDASDYRASLWTKPEFFCAHHEAQ